MVSKTEQILSKGKRIMVCTKFGEIYSCCSLTVLPSSALVLLDKIYKLFSSSQYFFQCWKCCMSASMKHNPFRQCQILVEVAFRILSHLPQHLLSSGLPCAVHTSKFQPPFSPRHWFSNWTTSWRWELLQIWVSSSLALSLPSGSVIHLGPLASTPLLQFHGQGQFEGPITWQEFSHISRQFSIS